jgi:FkbM family methyltransferase
MRLIKRATRRRLGGPGIPPHEASRFLPLDPVIVEAGAHDGRDTAELAALWPQGTVHAFEPIPHVFRRLEERAGRLGNVRLHRSALGAKTGMVPMWVSEGGDASSSILAPKAHLDAFPSITFERQLEVPITTLDDWARAERVKHVDFLWLDMQGHELTALQHATTVLHSVRAMIIEVFTEELYDGAPLWPEVRAWLEGQGFRVELQALGKTYGDALLVSVLNR